MKVEGKDMISLLRDAGRKDLQAPRCIKRPHLYPFSLSVAGISGKLPRSNRPSFPVNGRWMSQPYFIGSGAYTKNVIQKNISLLYKLIPKPARSFAGSPVMPFLPRERAGGGGVDFL